jgi:hypothetical protein
MSSLILLFAAKAELPNYDGLGPVGLLVGVVEKLQLYVQRRCIYDTVAPSLFALLLWLS